MDDRRMPIMGLERSADLLRKIWPDQIGKSISNKARADSEELIRIEARQEFALEKAKAVRQFCEEILAQGETDKQKPYGQKRRFFR